MGLPGQPRQAWRSLRVEERATGAHFRVTTDDRGYYHLLGLAASRYSINVEKSGFQPLTQTGITLRIGDQIQLNLELELGEASQSVEVNAEASLLETASGTVSFHVAIHRRKICHSTAATSPRWWRSRRASLCPAVDRCCPASMAAVHAKSIDDDVGVEKKRTHERLGNCFLKRDSDSCRSFLTQADDPSFISG